MDGTATQTLQLLSSSMASLNLEVQGRWNLNIMWLPLAPGTNVLDNVRCTSSCIQIKQIDQTTTSSSFLICGIIQYNKTNVSILASSQYNSSLSVVIWAPESRPGLLVQQTTTAKTVSITCEEQHVSALNCSLSDMFSRFSYFVFVLRAGRYLVYIPSTSTSAMLLVGRPKYNLKVNSLVVLGLVFLLMTASSVDISLLSSLQHTYCESTQFTHAGLNP